MNSSKRGSNHVVSVVLPQGNRTNTSDSRRHGHRHGNSDGDGNGNGHFESHDIAVATPSEAVTGGKPTQEMISAAAYQIWVGEGRIEGSDRRHWFEAEAQLRSGPPSSKSEGLPTAPRGDSLQAFVAPREVPTVT